MTAADRAHRLIRPEAPWIGRRACTFDQRHLFFPVVGDTESAREAKAICAGCECRAECLQYALDNHENVGIWGGTSARDRRGMVAASLRSSFGGCGTIGGYKRHRIDGEEACAVCKRANAEYQATRRVAS